MVVRGRRPLVRLLDDPPSGDHDRLDHQQPQVPHDRVRDPLVVDVVALDVEAEAVADQAPAVGERTSKSNSTRRSATALLPLRCAGRRARRASVVSGWLAPCRPVRLTCGISGRSSRPNGRYFATSTCRSSTAPRSAFSGSTARARRLFSASSPGSTRLPGGAHVLQGIFHRIPRAGAGARVGEDRRRSSRRERKRSSPPSASTKR